MGGALDRWRRRVAASTVIGRAGTALVTATIVASTQIEHLPAALIDGSFATTGLMLIGTAQSMSRRGH